MASQRYEVRWVRAWAANTSPYEVKHHGVFDSLEEAQDSVREWWKKNNFEPYYVRQMTDKDGNVWWDYGPHTAFYMFVRIDKNDERREKSELLCSNSDVPRS